MEGRERKDVSTLLGSYLALRCWGLFLAVANENHNLKNTFYVLLIVLYPNTAIFLCGYIFLYVPQIQSMCFNELYYWRVSEDGCLCATECKIWRMA